MLVFAVTSIKLSRYNWIITSLITNDGVCFCTPQR